MKPINSLVLTRSLLGVALLAFSVWSATALPNITSVVERGGDAEATDTITARFTGQTFVNGVANEPIAGKAATDPYTVGALVEEAPAFVDRNHQLTGATPTILIPQYLLGGEYIMSGNDNRDNATYELDITISRDSNVYFLVFQPDNAGQNMYSIVIKEVPRTPTVTLSAGDLFGVSFEVTDGAVTALNPNSVTLRLTVSL